MKYDLTIMENENRQKGLTKEEIANFHQRVNGYSPEVQEYIGDLSSFLLEPDVYKTFTSNQDAVKGISDRLTEFGLQEIDKGLVMRYFKLPFEHRPTDE